MNKNSGTLAIRLSHARQSETAPKLEKLTEEWRVWGYRLALKITGCPEAASDAVQEALIRAFRAREQLSLVESPRGWFRKVLVRCAIDQKPRDILVKSVQKTSSDNVETGIQVRDALHRLEAKHRAVLALAVGERLSYEEIAELLEIPVGTVGSRLFAAKEAFRRVWEADGG